MYARCALNLYKPTFTPFRSDNDTPLVREGCAACRKSILRIARLFIGGRQYVKIKGIVCLEGAMTSHSSARGCQDKCSIHIWLPASWALGRVSFSLHDGVDQSCRQCTGDSKSQNKVPRLRGVTYEGDFPLPRNLIPFASLFWIIRIVKRTYKGPANFPIYNASVLLGEVLVICSVSRCIQDFSSIYSTLHRALRATFHSCKGQVRYCKLSQRRKVSDEARKCRGYVQMANRRIERSLRYSDDFSLAEAR